MPSIVARLLVIRVIVVVVPVASKHGCKSWNAIVQTHFFRSEWMRPLARHFALADIRGSHLVSGHE